MGTDAGNLLFSNRFLTDSVRALRNKLSKLAHQSLDHDIYVDTLLGMHFDPGVQLPVCESFLLFDFYRIFLWENSASSDGPKINSVVRYLVDDYSVNPVKILAPYAPATFHFFHPLEILDILPLLWGHRDSGRIITLDLFNPEIRTAQASVHPECERPQIQTSGEQLLATINGTTSLKSGFTGANMRAESKPKLDDLISPDVGIIRRENKIMGRLSFPVAISQIANGHTKALFCGGRAANMPEAVNTSRCEAVERHQVAFLNPLSSLVYGTYEQFRDIAIDPEILCFAPIRTAPSDKRVLYNSEVSMYWTAAQNPCSQATCFVPAQEIWFDTNTLPDENLCLMSSTNGCALGGSFEEAALFAILETIERDAFLTTWYLRRPCVQIVPASVQLEGFQLLWHRLQNAYPNYSFHLFDIMTDIAVPVVLCAAVKQHGRGPQVRLTLACRLHTDEAAFAALKDLSGLPDPDSYDETRAKELFERPEDVREPEDHAAFYSLQETFGRLSFLGLDGKPQLATRDIDQGTWIHRQSRYDLKVVIEELFDRLDHLGINVFLKDLTHREFLCRNLFCVRAIMPGLFPMWFGYYSIRFRMNERLRSLSERYLGKSLDNANQINLDIHPFD
ncbi:MAG TPA: YcaO-like family protein [Candidatus Angelobacter sp.]|nr:YcaO-like family protein [Candidatus Angelobacter sp.]